MPESVAGTIVRTFYSDATFSAGILKCDDGERIRFRGKFYAAEGDRLAAVGRWTADPQYGPQFEVQELDYELPRPVRASPTTWPSTQPSGGSGRRRRRRLPVY